MNIEKKEKKRCILSFVWSIYYYYYLIIKLSEEKYSFFA